MTICQKGTAMFHGTIHPLNSNYYETPKTTQFSPQTCPFGLVAEANPSQKGYDER
jgi:hypothetical protein